MKSWLSEKAFRYCVILFWLLAGLGAVVWTVVGSVGYWARNGWLPADTAGWAQAIGAIVAIVVAIAVPYYQNHQQQAQREELDIKQRLDGINAMYALLSHISGVLKRLRIVYSHNQKYGSPERQSVAHDLKQAAAMLREIPVTALSNEMVHFMVGLREVSNFGEFMGEKLVQFPEPIISLDMLSNVDVKIALIEKWERELESLEQNARSVR